MCMKSDNNTVKSISMVGVNGLDFYLCANYRVLCTKYGMNLISIMKVWNKKFANVRHVNECHCCWSGYLHLKDIPTLSHH